MTRKADFNAEDWSTIVDGPLYAGVRVIAADRGGTLRESLAMSRVYEAARSGGAPSPLLDEIVKAPPTLDAARLQRAPDEIGRLTGEKLGRAVALLQEHADPAEVDAYKTFVMSVAQAVAAAHKEGGFLGIGGTAISDAENAALDEISRALGTPPAGASAS
jgi:hypothetical protein